MTSTIRADLSAVLAGDVPAFALLYRPQWTSTPVVELLAGEYETVDRLADLPLPPRRTEASGPDVLALVPYRQIAERGLACHDDGTPLIALRVVDRARLSLADVGHRLPDDACELERGNFDLDDDAYADVARRIVADEIGRGEGSNFVIRRTWCGTVVNHSVRTALACFRRLLQRETGTHCTFLVWCGGRALVGATPERLISLRNGKAVMNPVSGTYRYPPHGPDVADLLRFLGDRKEAEELYMVVDEELKMMSRLCDRGVRVVGPQLTPMERLAHTGYLVTGHTGLDVREVLRGAMFAPTVTGSPLANACRVITRYERRGRGYYGGALAVIGQERGRRTLDASILIRTAEVGADGRLEIGVGSTLVRHCEPAAEVAETRVKAAALLAAFGVADPVGAAPSPHQAPARTRAAIADPRVLAALAARNDGLSRFWRHPLRARARADLRGRRVLIVDADDDFTAMLATQIRALGPHVSVRRTNECLTG
ncbi:MAG: chorismate-binding protein, partial [Micromonosporaceae bacterium]